MAEVMYTQDLCYKCGMLVMVKTTDQGRFYCNQCAWDKIGEVKI